MNECENCQIEFAPSRHSKGRFCSLQCAGSHARQRSDVKCAFCSTSFLQKDLEQKFCSRSCAAKRNNRVSKKRKPQGTCKRCEVPNTARSGRTYCESCWTEIKAIREEIDKTLSKKGVVKDLCECGQPKTASATRCIECHHKHMKSNYVYTPRKDLPTFDQWLSGEWSGSNKDGSLNQRIRKGLLVASGYRCQSPTCPVPGGFGGMVNPVTGNVPLEVDHIDGDCHNNTPDNLIVLCPTCHALTPTYRSLNKDSKRSWRRKSVDLTPTV